MLFRDRDRHLQGITHLAVNKYSNSMLMSRSIILARYESWSPEDAIAITVFFVALVLVYAIIKRKK